MLAYKVRIHPDHEQEGKQLWTREVCRCVYNRFLELYYGGELIDSSYQPSCQCGRILTSI